MAKRAGIYVRISQDPLGERAGVKRQREDCIALAERRGWDVADVYEDNDVSAWRGKARPAYARLLEDLKNAELDAIVCWHPDRLHRSTRELEDFIDLVEATKVAVATVNAGDYDLTTSAGRMTAKVIGAVAQNESEQKAERIRRKHLELAKTGKNGGGGYRPFGFESDRTTINKNEATVIREVAQRLLAGESLRSLAIDLNARGLSTPTGKRWTQPVLRRILLSPRIAGLREHQGEVVGKAEWAAIIDEKIHTRLRNLLLDPARLRNGGSNARRYLLTGFLMCGNCEAKMVARPRDDGARRYSCAAGPGFTGCNKIHRLAEAVEDLVTQAVFHALDTPRLTKQLRAVEKNDSKEAELLEAIRDEESKLDDLATDHYDKRIIAKTQYVALRERIEARIEDLRRQLRRLDHGTVLASLPSGGAALRQRWEERGLDWRRAVIKTVIDRVVVHPAVKGRNTFDPDQIEIVWRA